MCSMKHKSVIQIINENIRRGGGGGSRRGTSGFRPRTDIRNNSCQSRLFIHPHPPPPALPLHTNTSLFSERLNERFPIPAQSPYRQICDPPSLVEWKLRRWSAKAMLVLKLGLPGQWAQCHACEPLAIPAQSSTARTIIGV